MDQTIRKGLFSRETKGRATAPVEVDFAKAAGFPNVFAHGMFSFGVLARAITRWCGIDRLRQLAVRFVALTQVHDVVTCAGQVSESIERDGERLVRIKISATVQDGRANLTGGALVAT